MGVTFSPLQCEYLGVDSKIAFDWVVEHLKPEMIRIGAYWDRIEKEPNVFDFCELDWLIENRRQHKIPMIITIGMKAPRWPEFHIPQWVPDDELEQCNAALRYVEKLVEHLARNTKGIEIVQIENEPFHKYEINGNKRLRVKYIQAVVKIVRNRMIGIKTLLTSGVSTTNWWDWQDWVGGWHCLRNADVVGLNVYVKIGVHGGRYLTTHRLYYFKLWLIRVFGRMLGKEVIIAELQDEPWEHGAHVHDVMRIWPSWSGKQTTNTLEMMRRCGFKRVLLWGCEWHYRRYCMNPPSGET